MSAFQKLFSRVVSPSRAADMEAESRSWMVRCPSCGYERSVWETGGVRYKSAGTSRQLRKCPRCGKWTWHVIYRPAQGGAGAGLVTMPTGRPALPLWVLGLGILLTIAIVAVAIIFFATSLTRPVVNAGDAFMTALKTGDDGQAYALCAPDLQKELGDVPKMKTLVQSYRPARWNWTNRSIRNGVGQLDGSLTYADGKTGTAHLVLSQVGQDWKIVSFRMIPSKG